MASKMPSSRASKHTLFQKMSTFFCGGMPRVRPSDDGKDDEAVCVQTCTITPPITNAKNPVRLDLLANKRNETELDAVDELSNTASDAVTMSTPQPSPPSKLQCLTQELEDVRAHSAELQEQVNKLTADLKEKEIQEVAARFAHRTVLRAALGEIEAEKAAVVAGYEGLLEEQALSALAQKAMLQDALTTAEEDKIRLAKEFEDRLEATRIADKAVLQGALQSMEETVAELTEARGVQRALLKHVLESLGEKERRLQGAQKEVEQRRLQCRRALRRQWRAEEALEAATKQVSDANDNNAALWQSIQYYQAQLEDRGHKTTQLPIFSEADCPFVDHLGAGAFASVDRCSTQFAVKKPKNAAEAEWLRREAGILACLHHPNIVKVLGWVQPQDDGHQGLAMAYENGGNLKNFIRRAHRGAPPGYDPRGKVGLLILDGLAAGLQYAHSQSKVHSDLKPENILLRIDGSRLRPVIADWGLGYDIREQGIKWRGSVGFGRPGGVLNPQLLGPEDDIRALCADAFELFTGLDMFALLFERLKEKDEDADPFWRRKINMACDEFGLDKESLSNRMLVGEALGVMSVTEEDVAHLLVDPLLPNDTVRVIMRGLSKERAAGLMPMPSLADIRKAIQGDLQRQQVLEAMGLHL